jgi:uncharacterized membrane protein YdjX (TVP38/TMEM64 family)
LAIAPLLFLAAGGAAFLALRFDLAHLDGEAVAQELRALGPVGPVVLFALFVLQCVVAPLPSEPLMMAAGFVYGRGPGFVIAWVGVVTGACACFALAGWLGRAFVLRFVSPARLAAADAYFQRRGVGAAFATILFIRLFAFSSFDVVSYGCGLLRVPFGWFLLASAVGVVPKVLAFTYLGANVSEQPAWLATLILVGTFGALLAVPWLIRRGRGTAGGLTMKDTVQP